MLPMLEYRDLGNRLAWSALRIIALFCYAMVALDGCGSKDQPEGQSVSNTD